MAVARNPNTPEDVLRALAQGDAKDVKRYVARNPNLKE
jgi:hypothetical protein